MEPTIHYLKIDTVMSGNYELVAAEEVSKDQYKLVENPICGSLNYGTTVIATPNEAGELEVKAVASYSKYKTRQFIRASSLTYQQMNERIAEPVLAAGGLWETGVGGIAYAHIPMDSIFDLDALFTKLSYYPLEITGWSVAIHEVS